MAQRALPLGEQGPVTGGISPLRELGAYEHLWLEDGASFKRIANLFRERPDCLPSDLVPGELADEAAQQVLRQMLAGGVPRFGVRVHRAGEYPNKLRDAEDPVELLYFQGFWELTESPCIAVVGMRTPSDLGRKRTERLVTLLTDHGWTVVSGLAAGIDTVVHQTALANQGRTIAVLGTSLPKSYPRDNRDLQRRLAREELVISQVPVLRYARQGPKVNRFFFPERNKTMSALTVATIIVEAGETSGTLTQARAALKQGREVFILNNCFENPALTWPGRLESQGAIRVREFDAILDALS